MRLQDKVAISGGDEKTASLDKMKVPSVVLSEELSPYSAKEPSMLALGCTFSHTICASFARERSLDAARTHSAFAGTVGCGLITDPMRPDAADLFSEDPYLAGELLDSYASAGVIGFVFCDALGQGGFVNRTVDARALNELYLYPLRKAGKYAAALWLDGGYLNGERVASSRSVADMYLKFIPSDAMLITQYGDGDAVSVVAGNGAYRLGSDGADIKSVYKAVTDGTLNETKLNRAVERTLGTVVKTVEFYKKPFARDGEAADLLYDSAVLLKNDGTLPAHANNLMLFGDPEYFDDSDMYPLTPIKDSVKAGGKIKVFLVTDYGEGLPKETVDAIKKSANSTKTVVALIGECATELPDIADINAVVFCPYCPSLHALVNMLTCVSPRGHLPFSWCERADMYPRNNKKFIERGDFRYESVFNGYMLFNNFAESVLFPFGHGLNYTQFEISKFDIQCDKLNVTAEFVVKNTGEMAGTALCQLYFTLIGGSVYGMSKRLCAFKRIALEPTENSYVVLNVNLNDFAVYDEGNQCLVTVGGRYKFELGLSSTDIRAAAEVKVPAGSRVGAGNEKKFFPSYFNTGKKFEPTALEIEHLLKVPFIKKPDVYPELDPPQPASVKHFLKRADKTVAKRLLPLVRYKIKNTPLRK